MADLNKQMHAAFYEYTGLGGDLPDYDSPQWLDFSAGYEAAARAAVPAQAGAAEVRDWIKSPESPGERALRAFRMKSAASHPPAQVPAPDRGVLSDTERRILANTIIGLRDGWATRKDADQALSIIGPAPGGGEPSGRVGNAEIHTLRRLIECAEALNKRPHPLCRDCADNDGVCPTTGLECDMRKLFADAKALHNKLVAAAHPQGQDGGEGK